MRIKFGVKIKNKSVPLEKIEKALSDEACLLAEICYICCIE